MEEPENWAVGLDAAGHDDRSVQWRDVVKAVCRRDAWICHLCHQPTATTGRRAQPGPWWDPSCWVAVCFDCQLIEPAPEPTVAARGVNGRR